MLGEGSKQLRIKYGDVISHEPSLAGRSTAVLEAESDKNPNLIVKVSWPGSKRVAEHKFLEKAIRVAKGNPEHRWALNHLPNAVCAQEVIFDSDSTHGKVAKLFKKAEFSNENYEYEGRTLRIIVQERLYPLKTLTDVKEIAQVLLDIICSEQHFS